jgi:hypothetical protein
MRRGLLVRRVPICEHALRSEERSERELNRLHTATLAEERVPVALVAPHGQRLGDLAYPRVDLSRKLGSGWPRSLLGINQDYEKALRPDQHIARRTPSFSARPVRSLMADQALLPRADPPPGAHPEAELTRSPLPQVLLAPAPEAWTRRRREPTDPVPSHDGASLLIEPQFSAPCHSRPNALATPPRFS